MNSKTPYISVVIPAFNEEKYLPQTLTALTRQTYKKPFEVIVVDNNSTDKTAHFAQKFGVRIVFEKKPGVIFAKQAGCKIARGAIIAVLESDNIPSSDWLSTIDELLTNPQIAAVTGPYIIPDTAPLWSKVQNDLFAKSIAFVQKITGNAFHIWGGSVAFRKKTFENIGGFDTRYNVGEDEIGIRHKLGKYGRVVQDKRLGVITSTRRFKKGPIYYFFVYVLQEYILNYLFTSVTKKKLRTVENLRREVD